MMPLRSSWVVEVEAEPYLCVEYPSVSNIWVLLVWMQRRCSRHRVSGIHSCFMIGVVVESWMFAISGPSVASYFTTSRGMLKFLALEKSFADGVGMKIVFRGITSQDPCSDG